MINPKKSAALNEQTPAEVRFVAMLPRAVSQREQFEHQPVLVEAAHAMHIESIAMDSEGWPVDEQGWPLPPIPTINEQAVRDYLSAVARAKSRRR